jgi:hypothetical protein
MNTVELYEKTLADRHVEIIISGDRVLLDGEEYVLAASGEPRLVRANKQLTESLDQIAIKLGAK